MNITYRRSQAGDEWRIQNLLYDCFGNRNDRSMNDIDKGRYLLAFDGRHLVAMSGISNLVTDFNGNEVDWTASDPKYRGQGIMTTILQKEIDRVGRDLPIYCSAWRRGSDSIYLGSPLRRLGFREIIHTHRQFDNRYYKVCEAQCCYRDNGCPGHCYEDLYVLDAIENKGDK